MIAVTLDQQHSRRDVDRVPRALVLIEDAVGDAAVLAPERTAGDEVQLLLADAEAAVRLVEAFTREGGWWLGLGVGAVDLPLPRSTREARGPAYQAARRAVERAKRTPHGCAVECDGANRASGTVGARPYGGAMDSPVPLLVTAADAEAALWLQQSLLSHRSAEGWQVVDLLDSGLGVAEAAQQLGISASAVSQRHQRAGRDTARRGHDLCTHLLAGLDAACDPRRGGPAGDERSVDAATGTVGGAA